MKEIKVPTMSIAQLNDGILGKLYPVRSPLVDPQVKDQVNDFFQVVNFSHPKIWWGF